MEKFSMENSEQPKQLLRESQENAEQRPSPERMRKYRYSFVFVPPYATESGVDAEYIKDFFVIAESPEKALEWGKKLSDEYIRKVRERTEDLYVRKITEDILGEGVVMKSGIEAGNAHADIPVVRYGEDMDLHQVFREPKDE